MPIGGRGQDIVDILPRFRQMASEAGRNPDDLPITLFAFPEDEARLGQARDAGVERIVFSLPSEGGETMLPKLDALAELAGRVG